MKNTLRSLALLWLCLQSVTVTTGQGSNDRPNTSIIYDAIILADNLDDFCAVADILAPYGIDSEADLRGNQLLSRLLLQRWTDCFGQEGPSKSTNQRQVLPPYSGIGGLDVTRYADGLARFLVTRAKEELTIEFFEDFDRAINKYEDLRTLFPETAATLSLIGSEIFQYQRYINTLREQFARDLDLLPEHFQQMIEDNHPLLLEDEPVLKMALLTGKDLISGIRDRVHPGDIISDLSITASLDPGVAGIFQTLKLLSESIREREPLNLNQYWINKADLRIALRNEPTFRIFLGLLAQKARKEGIRLGREAGQDLFTLLMRAEERLDELRAVFEELIAHTATIDRLIRNREELAEQLVLPEINRYLNAVNGLLQSPLELLDVLQELSGDTISLPVEDLVKIFETVDQFGQLYSNVAAQNYSSAIVNVSSLYQNLLDPQASDPAVQEALQVILKYGTFTAAMLSAENYDQVAYLIETFALPAGSARLKRETARSISLNAYLGPFAGLELSALQGEQAVPVIGLSAPVGVAYNWGKKGRKEQGSLSLLFSLIDIGTIAELRFSDEENDLARIYLREIFSPGAFLSWGLPNAPFSINFGAQQTALLRSVAVTGGEHEVVLKRTGRLSISFVVDIPLINFYARP